MIAHQSDRYPAISHYALIGDSRASALVSLDGSVDWMCLPTFDSPSVFGRILDWDRGGYFQLVPEVPYTARRRYIDSTNVLETTFHTDRGDVALIDFMPAQTERVKRLELAPLRMLIRIVEGKTGRVPMRISYVPRPEYGVGGVRLHGHTPTQVTALRGRNALHLRSDIALDIAPYDARGRFDVGGGDRVRFSLAYSHDEPAVIVSDGYVDQLYDETVGFWRDWSSQIDYDGPYRNEVVRSALALKLLSYAPSGAIVAAPTTSLPECIGGPRNWDYRYCWIRDAAFTVKAFLSIGLEAEANAFFGWLMHATHQTAPQLNPLYSILGEPHIRERELDHLEGYRGSTPVRIGNAAYNQHQLDVYGELIDAIHSYLADQDGHIASDEAKFVSQVADFVADHWEEPDSGIWEPRTAPQQYVESKVMAWNALTKAAALAKEHHIKGNAARWEEEAGKVHDAVLEHGYNREIGAFTQVFGGTGLDSAVLAISIVRFIAPDDPRMLSTIDALQSQLSENGFLKRYTDFDDGIEGGEGAFVFCNFWLASALAQARRTAEAHAVFEHTMTAANDLGLFSEEYDSASKTSLGNFPQGLSHLALITAALALKNAESGSVDERRQWPSAK